MIETLPSARFELPRDLHDRLVRHIKRNEKTLLRSALLELAIDPSVAPLYASSLYEAAGHKNGADVSTILVEAGVRSSDSKAIRNAIKRGHLDVAQRQALSLDCLNSGWHSSSIKDHPLMMAAASGNEALFKAMFAIPVLRNSYQGDPAASGFISPEEKANAVLRCLSTTTLPHEGHGLVGHLVECGADLEHIPETAFSAEQYPALGMSFLNGQWAMAAALADAGASTSLPKGNISDLFVIWLGGSLKKYDRKAQLTPSDWEGATLLAQWGIPQPKLMDMDDYWRFEGNTSCYIRREDGYRILALNEEVLLERQTSPAISSPSRSSLRL